MFKTLALWSTLAAERRKLRTTDQALLDDIGLTAAEARQEADRPFWDVPSRRAGRHAGGARRRRTLEAVR